MARVKALFISLYPFASLFICAHALWLGWQDRHWLWAGPLLVNVPILVLLGWLVSLGPARTSPHLPLATLCAWLGASKEYVVHECRSHPMPVPKVVHSTVHPL